ncbi:MAG: hypothetical protein SFU27_09900 [Thermonemataceae bacterium]|nr:hypothetical protein [Thermonemataceae bacterium]
MDSGLLNIYDYVEFFEKGSYIVVSAYEEGEQRAKKAIDFIFQELERLKVCMEQIDKILFHIITSEQYPLEMEEFKLLYGTFIDEKPKDMCTWATSTTTRDDNNHIKIIFMFGF